MNLEDFVVDGVVSAAASMFPTLVEVSSMGQSPCRFLLVLEPVTKDWWAMAWVSSATGDPSQILFSRVERVHTFSTSRVELATEDRGQVVVTPSGGGCCGNRLRSFNPFPAATLAHLPLNSVEIPTV